MAYEVICCKGIVLKSQKFNHNVIFVYCSKNKYSMKR